MNKRMLIVAVLIGSVAVVCQGAMVTERWGVQGHLQHPDTLTYTPRDDGAILIRLDLSALPRDTAVHRARLFFTRPGLYGRAFDIVPCEAKGEGPDAEIKIAGSPLQLVPPYFQWFDATAMVRQWVKNGRWQGLLALRQAPNFDRKATCLEIAYEAQLTSPPQQVTGLKAFYRNGQIFVTFEEIEDYAAGNDDITWGELSKRLKDIHYTGPIPNDEPHEVRYRVYMHDGPITAATIGKAELLGEVVPGSMYNTRLLPGGNFIKRRPEAVALRLAIEPGEALAPGTGLYVHTVRQDGSRYYAVVTAVDGVENTVTFSEGNTAGPIKQLPIPVEPVLQDIPKAHGHNYAGTTELRDGRIYHERWYSYWAVPPQAPRPLRYDFAVGFCPDTIAKPAPLTFTRGHTWGPNPEMPRPEPRAGIVISMSTDNPNGFWTGINDARDTLKGIEDGTWRPFTHNRQEALIRWAQRNWDIDEQRITSAIGAWGMWEIKRADLYAYIHGWGMPEVTKGFQCWNWARGAWGQPEVYEDKPNDENPFYLQDYTRWVLDNPAEELPYFYIHTGWGAHFTEMGWPPFPRFVRAMIDTKRAFCMQSRAVQQAVRDGIIIFRRDQSLPAFGNCSLDDNIGSGELGTGTAFGQINGYLLWETATITDEPDTWEMTVWLDSSAPLAECTVDLTPRRCRRFEARPGQQLRWTNTVLEGGKEVQSGTARTDEYGLITIRDLAVTKKKHRIRIRF